MQPEAFNDCSVFDDQLKFSLADTYMNFNMRDSYLQRQSNHWANQADSILIRKEDYETQSCNVWSAPDNFGTLSLYPTDSALDVYTGNFSDKVSWYNTNTNQLNIQTNILGQQTQSLYCPTANLIVPYQQQNKENASESGPDVTLETDGLGNHYLHLVLPADRINFLNGLTNANDTFFHDSRIPGAFDLGSQFGDENPAQLFIEVGCKVFEVNRVAYRPRVMDFDEITFV